MSCGCMYPQGFPVMNNGAPLLLNLQPSQTVQPLTLIQCRTPPTLCYH